MLPLFRHERMIYKGVFFVLKKKTVLFDIYIYIRNGDALFLSDGVGRFKKITARYPNFEGEGGTMMAALFHVSTEGKKLPFGKLNLPPPVRHTHTYP